MEVDVVVIGGGPGGCTASTLIAQQGHQVLLLERDRFPRHRIGESLLPSSIHGVFALTGVKEKLDQAGFVRKSGGIFHWGKNPEPWGINFAESVVFGSDFGYAYQVERSRFDQILLEHAREKGVDAREGHRALEILFEGERATGVRFLDPNGQNHVVKARYIVDGGGSNSLLAKKIGQRVYDPFFKNVAIYRYFEHARRLPGENSGNILVAAFSGGWFWFIPLSDTLTSVGAVIDGEYLAGQLKDKAAEKILDECIADCPTIAEMLEIARDAGGPVYGKTRVVKDYSYLNERFWCPGAVMIGDAACFIDPLFSSGVHLATYSALLAALSVNTCLAGDLDETKSFMEFETRYRREYAAWHMLVMGFYDTHRDKESYFWKARSILSAEQLVNSGNESARESFITLLGGGLAASTDKSAYFERMRKTSSTYQEVIAPDPASGAKMLDAAGRAAIKGKLWQEAMQLIDHNIDQKVGGNGWRPSSEGGDEQPLFAGGLVVHEESLKWRVHTPEVAETTQV